MTARFVLLVLLLASPAAAQQSDPPKPLTLQQATAIKCSAAFALGAAAQARGEGREWPVIIPRGREFMVRASAQVMDETGRTRDAVASELAAQAKGLAEPGALGAAMAPCLLLLDAAGL